MVPHSSSTRYRTECLHAIGKTATEQNLHHAQPHSISKVQCEGERESEREVVSARVSIERIPHKIYEIQIQVNLDKLSLSLNASV